MNAIEQLKDLARQHFRKRYPSVPDHAVTVHKYSDKSANGLTKCVIDFLKFSGWQAERISTTGRLVDNRKVVTDVIGRQKTIGSSKWIKGSGTKGSADLSATIAGRSVKIEIKMPGDRQSSYQKAYQESIEKAGGVYFIARSFQQFYQWYYEFAGTHTQP